MKPLMYRQRPAFPALMGAVFCLAFGAFSFCMVQVRVKSGELGEEKLWGLALLCVSVSLIFLIAAFARYRFTHLWVKPRRRNRRHREGIRPGKKK